MKPFSAFLVLFVSLSAPAQTSDGTFALSTKSVTSTLVSNCKATDSPESFWNERSTCSQGQTGFFNGEIRRMVAGQGTAAHEEFFNVFEISSCGCSLPGTWTRTFDTVDTPIASYIRWTWKYFARNTDCSLTLKRDLNETFCWYRRSASNDGCDCPEGTVCTGDAVLGYHCDTVSPIVIDLVGDDIRLTSRLNGAYFDIDGDGQRGLVSWPDGDAWLVFNERLDGIVVDGQQLFGDRSPQPDGEDRNGYHALQVFDDNLDSRITPRDGVWNLLAMWMDDGDGFSEPGEVRGLSVVGIAAINLDHKENRRRDPFGNQHRYWAWVEWVDGRTTKSVDVFLTGE